MELGDEGGWKCNIENDAGHGPYNTKFIFVQIGGRDGPEILMKDNLVVSVIESESAALICPTSIRPRSHKVRPTRSHKDGPTCVWFGPSGKKYDMIGR